MAEVNQDVSQAEVINSSKPEKYSTSSMVFIIAKFAVEALLLIFSILLGAEMDNDGTLNVLLAMQTFIWVPIGLQLVNTVYSARKAIRGDVVDHSSYFNWLRKGMRNLLAAMIVTNAAIQFGAVESHGESYEMFLFILALVSSALLEPALNVRGPENLLEVTCVGNDTKGELCGLAYSNRSVKKILVFLLLGASTTALAVDVVDKYPDGLTGSPAPSTDTYWYIALLFSLLSIHLFLIVLSVIGNTCGEDLKGKFVDRPSECDGDESTFHGYNEIPIVRAIVIAAAISLISLMIGADITDDKDISLQGMVLAGLIFADFVGGNEV